MKIEIGSYEAKTKLPELLRQVKTGKSFTITNRGKAIADLVPSLSAGNVIFPLSASFTPSPRTGITATIADLIGEAGAFPKGANDDGIDMLAYAVNRYLTSEEGAALAALAAGTPDLRQIQDQREVADGLATMAGALRGPAF